VLLLLLPFRSCTQYSTLLFALAVWCGVWVWYVVRVWLSSQAPRSLWANVCGQERKWGATVEATSRNRQSGGCLAFTSSCGNEHHAQALALGVREDGGVGDERMIPTL